MARIGIVVCVLAAIVAGIALTLVSVAPASRLVGVTIGQWRFAAHAGAEDADPFVRARLFLSGELPVASGQGYTLRTYVDSMGASLSQHCTYRLTGPLPAARYWTLTLTDKDGRIVPNLLERHAFTSAEIVRRDDARFAVEIGPLPLAGNWLPSGNISGPFVLDMRFYDTPLSGAATQLLPEGLPRVDLRSCAP